MRSKWSLGLILGVLGLTFGLVGLTVGSGGRLRRVKPNDSQTCVSIWAPFGNHFGDFFGIKSM